jgi:hypothetical protein
MIAKMQELLIESQIRNWLRTNSIFSTELVLSEGLNRFLLSFGNEIAKKEVEERNSGCL